MNDQCIATPPPAGSLHNTQRNEVRVQCALLAQSRRVAIVCANHACADQGMFWLKLHHDH